MPTRTAKLLGQLTLDRQYKTVRSGITEQLLPQGQQEEITTMADQSSAELNASNNETQSVPLNTDPAEPADAQTTGTAPAEVATQTPPAATPAAPAQTNAQNAVVSPSQANVDAVTAPAATAPATTAPAAATANSAPGAAPLPTDQAGVTNTADANALAMTFTADCWLEVTDANGKKLFSGIQPMGTFPT